MNCKYCNAPIDDDILVCPVCNRVLSEDSEETIVVTEEAVAEEVTVDAAVVEPECAVEETEEACEQAAVKKRRTVKITAIVCSIVLLLGILGVCAWGIIRSLDEGTFGEDDVMAKTVYTAEAEEARRTADKVVAKVGNKTLTNSQLQVFYWMEVMNFIQQNQYYLSYYGLDPTQPLSTQYMSEGGLTWEQYFLDMALTNWHYNQCMMIEAEKNGYVMSEELQKSVDDIETNMEANLVIYGCDTVDEMLQQDMGAIANLDSYVDYVRMYYTGAEYGASLYLTINPTAEDVEAYWNTNGQAVEETYNVNKESGPLVDVRHILIGIEGGTKDASGNTVYSDEEWAACLKKAEALLAEWKEGAATEESFSLLANTHSTDPGSNTTGGLYSYVYQGQMVPEFNDWCFDTSRKHGDTGIVRSDYGYHIMYFVTSGEGWFRRSEQMFIEDTCTEILAGYMQENPLLVSYENILLSTFSLF